MQRRQLLFILLLHCVRQEAWNLDQFSVLRTEKQDLCIFILWTWKLKMKQPKNSPQGSNKWRNWSGRPGRSPILCSPSSVLFTHTVQTATEGLRAAGLWMSKLWGPTTVFTKIQYQVLTWSNSAQECSKEPWSPRMFHGKSSWWEKLASAACHPCLRLCTPADSKVLRRPAVKKNESVSFI
jgi:hypothetical protein